MLHKAANLADANVRVGVDGACTCTRRIAAGDELEAEFETEMGAVRSEATGRVSAAHSSPSVDQQEEKALVDARVDPALCRILATPARIRKRGLNVKGII